MIRSEIQLDILHQEGNWHLTWLYFIGLIGFITGVRKNGAGTTQGTL